ncbi:hypothetical protein GCM10020000_78610 [Streptomyces olivoverticillatus]
MRDMRQHASRPGHRAGGIRAWSTGRELHGGRPGRPAADPATQAGPAKTIGEEVIHPNGTYFYPGPVKLEHLPMSADDRPEPWYGPERGM